jgi:hypothetical protein
MNPGNDAVAQRQLQAWIEELDAKVGKGREYQGLIDVVHPSSNTVVWVCAEHKLELEACNTARKKVSVKKDATKKAVVKDKAAAAAAAASKQKKEKKKDTGKKSGKQKSAKPKKNQVVPM